MLRQSLQYNLIESKAKLTSLAQQLEEREIPVADYTDHSRGSQTQPPPEEEDPDPSIDPSIVDEGFTSANEEWDIDDFKPDQESEQLLFLNPDFNGYFEEITKEFEADGEEPEQLRTSLHVGYLDLEIYLLFRILYYLCCTIWAMELS
jgi:hypothetical protein